MQHNVDLQVIQNQFADYFAHLDQRVERMTRMLSPDQLWVNPFPFGNSVGKLVVHLTGSLNHFIGEGLAGSGYVRDREFEFSDASMGRSADEILAAFHRTVEMVIKAIRAEDGESLAKPYTLGGDLVHNRFGILLTCAAHFGNHIGQMVYLLHAHGYRFDDQSW